MFFLQFSIAYFSAGFSIVNFKKSWRMKCFNFDVTGKDSLKWTVINIYFVKRLLAETYYRRMFTITLIVNRKLFVLIFCLFYFYQKLGIIKKKINLIISSVFNCIQTINYQYFIAWYLPKEAHSSISVQLTFFILLLKIKHNKTEISRCFSIDPLIYVHIYLLYFQYIFNFLKLPYI